MSEDFKLLLQTKKFWIITVIVLAIIGTILWFIFQPKPAVVVDNTPVKITWWSIYPNTAYNETLNEFRKLPGNQNVSIDYVNIDYGDGSDYYKKLAKEFLSGTGPDIYTLRNDDLPAYKELLTPIKNIPGTADSKLLADFRTNFADLAVKDSTDRDQVYGTPAFLDSLQLYYNKSILEQSGIPLPPTTWNDLDTQLNLLNKRNTSSSLNFRQSAISLGTGTKKSNGDLTKDSNIRRFQDIIPALIFQNGGQIYDSQSKSTVFGQAQNNTNSSNKTPVFDADSSTDDQDNPSIQALKFYLNFSSTNSNRYSWNEESKNNLDSFLEGNLAYMIGYSDLQTEINQRNSRLRYGISELPQLNSTNKKTYGWYFQNVLSRNMEKDADKNPKDKVATKKLQKSREFLHFLSTKSAQQKFATATNLPSARKDVINEQISGDEKLRIFARGALYADSYYKPNVTKSEQIWGNMLYRIRFENQPAAESLRQAVSEYNLLVQKGPEFRV